MRVSLSEMSTTCKILCARHYSNHSVSVYLQLSLILLTENFPQFTDLGGFIKQFINGATSSLADRKEL